MHKVQTITSKGQITLPIAWRRRVQTTQITLRATGDHIEIEPVRLRESRAEEYTVFDALRDNKGKGLKARDLVRILRDIDG